jgi:hypothetical protein
MACLMVDATLRPLTTSAAAEAVPTLEQAKDDVQRNDWTRAYQYMGLNAGQAYIS